MLNFVKYIKEEYKGWIIAIIALPFFILFGKILNKLISINDFSNLSSIGLYVLCVFLSISFIIFGFFSEAFDFHEMTDYSEFELQDLNRFKHNLKKLLTVYASTLVIWIISIVLIFIKSNNTINNWKLIYLLLFPMIFFGIMIYIYKDIKTVYR